MFLKTKKKNFIEEYIPIQEIGCENFGTVLKVKMKAGGALRAAKIIKGEKFKKEIENREKYMNEILIPMKLDQPNIIKLT